MWSRCAHRGMTGTPFCLLVPIQQHKKLHKGQRKTRADQDNLKRSIVRVCGSPSSLSSLLSFSPSCLFYCGFKGMSVPLCHFPLYCLCVCVWSPSRAVSTKVQLSARPFPFSLLLSLPSPCFFFFFFLSFLLPLRPSPPVYCVQGKKALDHIDHQEFLAFLPVQRQNTFNKNKDNSKKNNNRQSCNKKKRIDGGWALSHRP